MAFAAPVAAGAGRAAAGRAAGSGATRKAAGRRAAGRRSSSAAADGVALTGGHSPEQVNAELQRRREEAAAAGEGAPEPASPASPASPAGGRGPLRGMEPAHSGAGFVLGLMAWTVAVNYLQGGVPQVRKLLRAKFLNQTD